MDEASGADAIVSPAGGDSSACALLRRCLGRRNEADWGRFVAEYGGTLPSLIGELAVRLGLWLQADEIEELAQDLYVDFLSHDGRRFNGHRDRQFWQYLRRCARHLLIDRRRRERARKRGGERPISYQAPNPVDRRDPEVRALDRESLGTFIDRCRSYGEGEGRALSLVFVAGLTSREVSHALNGSLAPKQVDNLVERFRRREARDGVHLPRRTPGPERFASSEGAMATRGPATRRC